jgi:excisionase family DNA binding protein
VCEIPPSGVGWCNTRRSREADRQKAERRPEGYLDRSDVDLDTEPLVDFDGAAHFLNTTPRQVRRLWETRRIGGVKIGRRVRFRRPDLFEFVETHRVPARNGEPT